MDSGCEISSHTSVRCGFIRNVLAHVFQEEGPFLDPTFPLRRWGVLPPYWFIERSCRRWGGGTPGRTPSRSFRKSRSSLGCICRFHSSGRPLARSARSSFRLRHKQFQFHHSGPYELRGFRFVCIDRCIRRSRFVQGWW